MSSSAAVRSSASTREGNNLAGIDVSSWTSWAAYGVGFGLALKLAPDMASDVLAGGAGAAMLIGSIALFFVLILAIQHHMRISLRNSTFGAPRRLVTSGVFSYSRNPMYVAFLLPLAAIGAYSPLAAALAIGLYVAAMNVLVISVEESVLAETFGAAFRDYQRATPRWV